MSTFKDWVARFGGYVVAGAFATAAFLLWCHPRWNQSLAALCLMVISVAYVTLVDRVFSIPYTEHEKTMPDQKEHPLAYREWYKDWYAIDAHSAAQLNVRLTIVIACWTFFGVFVSTLPKP